MFFQDTLPKQCFRYQSQTTVPYNLQTALFTPVKSTCAIRQPFKRFSKTAPNLIIHPCRTEWSASATGAVKSAKRKGQRKNRRRAVVVVVGKTDEGVYSHKKSYAKRSAGRKPHVRELARKCVWENAAKRDWERDALCVWSRRARGPCSYTLHIM